MFILLASFASGPMTNAAGHRSEHSSGNGLQLNCFLTKYKEIVLTKNGCP